MWTRTCMKGAAARSSPPVRRGDGRRRGARARWEADRGRGGRAFRCVAATVAPKECREVILERATAIRLTLPICRVRRSIHADPAIIQRNATRCRTNRLASYGASPGPVGEAPNVFGGSDHTLESRDDNALRE